MKTLWVAILVILVLLAGYFLFFNPPAPQAPADSGAAAADLSQTPPASAPENPASASVSYTDQGFSPASVTIANGQTVTWTNNSTGMLWVASDPHPEHSGYDGTTKSEHCAADYSGATPFDSCTVIQPGQSYSFTFAKAGSWGYHNHMNDDMSGTVVVTQ